MDVVKIRFCLFNEYDWTLAQFNSIYELPALGGNRWECKDFNPGQFWIELTRVISHDASRMTKTIVLRNPCSSGNGTHYFWTRR